MEESFKKHKASTKKKLLTVAFYVTLLCYHLGVIVKRHYHLRVIFKILALALFSPDWDPLSGHNGSTPRIQGQLIKHQHSFIYLLLKFGETYLLDIDMYFLSCLLTPVERKHSTEICRGAWSLKYGFQLAKGGAICYCFVQCRKYNFVAIKDGDCWSESSAKKAENTEKHC